MPKHRCGHWLECGLQTPMYEGRQAAEAWTPTPRTRSGFVTGNGVSIEGGPRSANTATVAEHAVLGSVPGISPDRVITHLSLPL